MDSPRYFSGITIDKVCSFEAENFYLLTTNALNKAIDYMFGVWLPRHQLSSEPFMAEVYFDDNIMEIWLKAQA